MGLLLNLVPPPGAAAGAAGDYTGWHLPLPAGAWTLSRGPCGSAAAFDHECGYYENACAIDLIPLAGSMENVPVLAPYTGRVFYIGTRTESGLMLMVRHPDERVSVYMHLAKTVVALDETVATGQVLAYAGRSGTNRPHLHFFVQPNAVERACVSVAGLDTLDYGQGRALSGNLAWADLTLPDPPAALPDWLPTLANRPAAGLSLPRLVQLQPGTTVNVPVLAGGPAATLTWAGTVLAPIRRASDYALFQVPLTAPAAPGDYEQRLEPSPGGPRQSALLRYSVRALQPWPAETAVLLSNADLVSPAGWSLHVTAPRLCWRLPARVAWRARVVVAGPTPAESDWLTAAACWQPPPLAAGTYYWKVFLQDAQGAQNRPNQRPFAFIVTTRP